MAMDVNQLRQLMAARGGPQAAGNVGPGAVPQQGGGPEQALQQALQAGDPRAVAAMRQAQGMGGAPGQPGALGPPRGGVPQGPVDPSRNPQGGDGEGGIMEYIRKLMEAKRKQAMLQQMAQQGGPGLQGPSGGMAPPRQDPEEQMMRQYLQKAMMEAQGGPPQGAPQGSATQAPVGAGQSTYGQVQNRGRDLDAMIRAAGG